MSKTNIYKKYHKYQQQTSILPPYAFQFWYIAIKTSLVSLILIRKIALKLNYIVGNEGVKKRVDQQLKFSKIGSSSFAKGTKRI